MVDGLYVRGFQQLPEKIHRLMLQLHIMITTTTANTHNTHLYRKWMEKQNLLIKNELKDELQQNDVKFLPHIIN